MGIEMEGQTREEHQQIKTREIQKESIERLNQVNDMIDNINIDGVIQDTKTIKNVVMNNLENQTDIDDVANDISKVLQGIADIKRSQTNINKKINELQDKIGE